MPLRTFPRLLLLFAVCSCVHSNREPLCIAIQPYGSVERALADSVAAAVRESFDMRTVIFKPSPIPEEAFISVKIPRYRADKIIRILRKEKPDSVNYVIGLTNFDISTTKTDFFGQTMEPKSRYEDWGIFGLGFRPGPSCIVSTFRLKHADRHRFLKRVKKVAIHEVGHNLGLNHCPEKDCVMGDAAESIRTIDEESGELCNACRKIVKRKFGTKTQGTKTLKH